MTVEMNENVEVIETEVVKEPEEKLDLDVNLRKFYAHLKRARRHDSKFGREDDVDLTEEEIKAIDEYWGPYHFAYPEIYYDSFKFFKNRSGKFDVRHCPGAIRECHFKKFFNNPTYHMAHQNKCMYPLLYPGVAKPITVVRRMAGIYYDEDYNPIKIPKVCEIIQGKLAEGKSLIAKPSGLGGGKKIKFFNPEDQVTETDIRAFLKELGNYALVVQEVLEQSDFMKQFNPTSLNTIRVTTFLWKEEVHALASLIRIGKLGSRVDNYTQGGSVLGIDVKTGICNKWAMNHDLERITTLPSGLVLDQDDLVVPNFNQIVAAVKKMHYHTPYTKLISWDMALDKDNVPTMIENNFAGSIQLHEAVNGPLFGEFMDELLETYLYKNFFVEFKTKEWSFREYKSNVVATKYLGNESDVVAPTMMKNKPVTTVLPSAFKDVKTPVKSFAITPKLAKTSGEVFENVKEVKIVE